MMTAFWCLQVNGGHSPGVGPRLAGFGFALAYFGVVGSLLGFIAFLGPSF